MPSTTPTRHSVKTRIMLTMMAILLVSLWTLSFYASQMLRHDMERLLGEQQMATASLLAKEINMDLEERMNALKVVAEKVTPAMLGKPATLQTLLEANPTLELLFNGGVFATGVDGTAIADVPRSAGRMGVNYMDRPAVAFPLKEGQPLIGPPTMGKKLKAPIFNTTVPFRDLQGRVLGVLVGTINLNQPNFLDHISQGNYGKTGSYLLVAPQQRLIVTASNKRRVMEKFSDPGINRPLVSRFFQGFEGSGVLTNALGEEVLASAKGVPVAG